VTTWSWGQYYSDSRRALGEPRWEAAGLVTLEMETRVGQPGGVAEAVPQLKVGDKIMETVNYYPRPYHLVLIVTDLMGNLELLSGITGLPKVRFGACWLPKLIPEDGGWFPGQVATGLGVRGLFSRKVWPLSTCLVPYKCR
jgi:hypothetical protein